MHVTQVLTLTPLLEGRPDEASMLTSMSTDGVYY